MGKDIRKTGIDNEGMNEPADDVSEYYDVPHPKKYMYDPQSGTWDYEGNQEGAAAAEDTGYDEKRPDAPPHQSGRKRKKHRKKHYLLKFLLICAVVTGLVWFAQSDYFNITSIQVTGNSAYTSQQILDKAELKTGTNIFKFRKKDLIRRIKEDPYLCDVTVKRKLPSKVVIHVRERVSTAIIPYGKKYVVIDGNGYVLKKLSKKPRLTELDGMTIKSMNKGEKIIVKEPDILSNTLSMLSAMKNSDLFFKKIDMSGNTINAYIYDQLICRGRPQSITKVMKDGSLEAVLYKLYKNGTKKGVLTVSKDGYCLYSPKIK